MMMEDNKRECSPIEKPQEASDVGLWSAIDSLFPHSKASANLGENKLRARFSLCTNELITTRGRIYVPAAYEIMEVVLGSGLR